MKTHGNVRIERIVKVPTEARTPKKAEYNGIIGVPVKDIFYTAGYTEDSTERYLEPMNHSETVVLDGGIVKMPSDILLQTGNGLIGLKPRAFSIIDSREEDDFVVYRALPLPRTIEETLLSVFGLTGTYETISAIGIEPHNERMRKLLSI